jgi:beta-galactosidase/beta-glucuronidase
VDVFLEGEGVTAADIADNTRIRAVVSDHAGTVVWRTTSALTNSEMVSLTGTIAQPRLWGPTQPALYTLDISLEGAVDYYRRTRFGFRELAARDGKLFLNGKPFFMIAALDQDFYPETIHTPASEEFVREMMLKAKKLGINVLRCHLKVAHPVYLDVAD